jgi:hypothetical protein
MLLGVLERELDGVLADVGGVRNEGQHGRDGGGHEGAANEFHALVS